MKHVKVRTKSLPKRAQSSLLDQLENWIENLIGKDI
jgi:hypothetical protein